jgi:SRSO17 transposase
MSYQFDVGAVARLDAYFAQIGACLRDKRKRESFAMCAVGILGEGECKSAEPIAARACGDVGEMQHTHDKLLHFLSRARELGRPRRAAGGRKVRSRHDERP